MRDLGYYLKLPYRVTIEQISESEGGGFTAYLPELGKHAVVSDGETAQEALSNLEEAKRAVFSYYLEEGIEIPKPLPSEDDYSGKFVFRLPKSLHRDLSVAAKDSGVSLNQYLIYLVSSTFSVQKIVDEIKTEIKTMRIDLNDHLSQYERTSRMTAVDSRYRHGNFGKAA